MDLGLEFCPPRKKARTGVMGPLQKALELNLDNYSYGTIAEIGAGQEVARTFFKAGGAAGTVAKTLSAFDMAINDAEYGAGGDYVSLQRLEAMLARELEHLRSLQLRRPPSTQYFAFAETVAARGPPQSGECHGWLGCRLQLHPHSEPSDIVLHVRMLDTSIDAQQDALGILGVNLIYGAFNHFKAPSVLLKSLTDNLFDDNPRITVDAVKMRGPYWDALDQQVLNLHLLYLGLTPVVLFNCDGEVEVPGELFHHKNALLLRGHFRPATNLTVDMVKAGVAAFVAAHQQYDMKEEEVV
eukprot:EG_transcript_21200